MAVSNKKYVQLSGAFTGTSRIIFQINMLSDAGTSWKWRKKPLTADGAYTEWTTVSSYNLNTSISLSDGMNIKFTRTSKSTYHNGDKWVFTCYPDLKLTSGTDTGYDHIDVIERGTKKDLVALNSNSGAVTVVEDYESNTPAISETMGLLSPNVGGYDIARKNKELYVACGTDNDPKWIGYTKNGNWAGELGDYAFINEKAYTEVTMSSVDKMTFDDHVLLEGGAASFSAAKLVVGINHGSNKLYVQNLTDSKIYVFTLGGNALCIRINTAQFTGTDLSSYECNGVAVLTQAQEEDAANELEFWSIPNTGSNIGQSTNRDKTFSVPRPITDNEYITEFSDFLIVCSNYDYWTGTRDHHLVFSAKGTLGEMRWSGTSETNGGCVFKYDNGAKATSLTESNYVNITPIYGDYSVDDSTGAGFAHFSYEDDGENDSQEYFTGSGLDGLVEHRSIALVQNYNLAFAGYDGDGANPQIAFTCELRPPEYYSNNYVKGIAGLWYDGGGSSDIDNGNAFVLRWVTSIIGYGNNGAQKNPILAHSMDYGNSEDQREAAWIAMSDRFGLTGVRRICEDSFWTGTDKQARVIKAFAPATHPYHCAGSNINQGKKLHFYGDKDNNGYRSGIIASRMEDEDSVRIFVVPYQGGNYTWSSNSLWVFPNSNEQPYTAFNTSAYTRTKPVMKEVNLPLSGDSGDGYFNIGDRVYWCANANNLPSTNEDEVWSAMVPVGGGNTTYHGNSTEALYKVPCDADDTTRDIANILSGGTAWLETSTLAEHGVTTWTGATVEKVFYKFSIVYDGYQESTLLDFTPTFKKSDDSEFDKAVTFEVKIGQGANTPITPRVTAIALYRADDSEATASDPENLYRFVEEIPLYKFSSSNDYWSYTVVDNGDVEGTYGAINGIAETMHSLDIKYSLNATLNGYMFVANASHTQFEDAENVIFRSQPGKYSIFDWSKDFLQVDFVPTAIEGYMGKLYVFGESQMAIINPESLIIEEEIAGIGCLNRKALKKTSTGLYWFDASNIYLSKPAIEKIGYNILAQEDYGWNAVSLENKKNAVAGYDMNRQAFLVFFQHNSTNKVWSYYSAARRWDLWETSHRVYDTTISSDGYPILLMDEGRLCKYTSGPNHRDWEWNSKKLTFGTDTNYKKVRVIKIDATSRASTDITYQTNDEGSYQAGTDVSNNYGTGWLGNAKKISSAHSKLRWLRLKASGDNNTDGSNVRGYSLGVVYKPKKPK